MQVSSLQSILNTNTFKDFHTPNSAVCSTLGVHSHLNNIENKAADVVRAEKPAEKNGIKKILPLAGAVIGTLLPLVILNNFKGKNLNMKILKDAALLEKLKEIGEYFEIEGAKEILLTAGGAIAGGLFGGVIYDKNKENRKEKVYRNSFKQGKGPILVSCFFSFTFLFICGCFRTACKEAWSSSLDLRSV